MLGFSALSETALSELPSAAPAGGVSGDLAITFDFDVAGSAAHGVAGSGAITFDFIVAGEAEYTSINIEGDLAITFEFAVSGSAAHGVAGSGAVDVGFSVAGEASHGVAGTGAVTLTFDVSGAAAHGVAGSGAITVDCAPTGDATHIRYELRGEVRQGGVLVNRRVRAYRRDTGEMVGEVDTVAGKFQLHTGFVEREHYLVPVNLAEDATDWAPPTANRVVSVLAQDA